MVEKIKNNRLLILFLFLVFSVFLLKHAMIDLNLGDDLVFRPFFTEMGLFEFVKLRYMTWSSRILIECVLVCLLQFSDIIWKILDSLVFVLAFYSIIKLLNAQNKISICVITFFLMVTFPFDYFGSAGWGATTLNYSWPLAFGLYSLCKLKDFTLNKYDMNFLWILALIFAANQEQMCSILFGFSIISFIYMYFKKKKFNIRYFVYLVIVILSLISHIICPGNAVRLAQEITSWYPTFCDLSIFTKISLGVLSTFSSIFISKEWVVLAFLLALILVSYNNGNVYARLSSLFSMISYVFLAYIYPALNAGEMPSVLMRYTTSKIDKPLDIWFIIYVLFIAIFIISITFAMYHSLPKHTFILSGVFICAAFASRFIMGVSPTIYASGTRTFVFMYYLIIISGLIMAFDIHLEEEK